MTLSAVADPTLDPPRLWVNGLEVVEGGRGAVTFEPVDAALNGMVLPVDDRVEGRRPTVT